MSSLCLQCTGSQHIEHGTHIGLRCLRIRQYVAALLAIHARDTVADIALVSPLPPYKKVENLQQIALQPQRHRRIWLHDRFTSFLHVDIENRFAAHALERRLGAECCDEPYRCYAVLAAGEDYKSLSVSRRRATDAC